MPCPCPRPARARPPSALALARARRALTVAVMLGSSSAVLQAREAAEREVEAVRADMEGRVTSARQRMVEAQDMAEEVSKVQRIPCRALSLEAEDGDPETRKSGARILRQSRLPHRGPAEREGST